MAAAIWGVGLLIVVGMAVAGGGIGAERAADPRAGIRPSAQPDAAAAATMTTTDAGSDAIVLDVPAAPEQVITTGELVVRGHLRSGAVRVEVLLRSSGTEHMILGTVGPIRQDWDRDRPQRAAFTVTLPLPDPRPTGPAVLQIVAYSPSGRAQGVLLRSIRIGALYEPHGGGLPGRPALGEDGLVGGIPFDTNWMGGSPATPETPGS